MRNIPTTALAACFAICALPAAAQNIVPNPNFTIRSSCPTLPGQIDRATGWYAATRASSDYLNGCVSAGSSSLGVPSNSFGNQSNFANAYAGIYTYDYDTGIGYREYIGTDIPPLTPGTNYKVTIRVSLGDQSKYASDGLGVYFYANGVPDTATKKTLLVTPQVDYSSYGVLSDKTGWTTLTKNFTADSAYSHAIIGCFLPNATQTRSTVTGSYVMAYYYIDSVAVESLATLSTSGNGNGINVMLYPNPVTTEATLAFDNPQQKPHTLRIYDAQGRLVESIENIVTNKVHVRENFVPGFYYYQLFDEVHMVGNGKMIVE